MSQKKHWVLTVAEGPFELDVLREVVDVRLNKVARPVRVVERDLVRIRLRDPYDSSAHHDIWCARDELRYLFSALGDLLGE
jgi:hypothetical protein